MRRGLTSVDDSGVQQKPAPPMNGRWPSLGKNRSGGFLNDGSASCKRDIMHRRDMPTLNGMLIGRTNVAAMLATVLQSINPILGRTSAPETWGTRQAGRVAVRRLKPTA